MEKWIYCCCVLIGLAVIVTIKDPIEHGKTILNILGTGDTENTVNPNNTKPVTKTEYTEDGFVDISETRTCVIKEEETISALQRVKSSECRERLTTVACLNQEDKLYPKTLPRFCPIKSRHEKGKYIGCFKDSKSARDMDGFKKNFGEFNSPQTCIDFCLQGSYKYAALQWGKECWCSDRYGKYGSLPDWACSLPCPANKSETCGGSNTNRVFSTGLPARTANDHHVVHSPSEVAGMKPVRIAYVLTVYGRAVRQVKRLIQILYRPHHYFLIHVDSRSNYMYRELLKLESVMPNVRLCRERLPAIWAGISLLQGHFSFMKSLLAMTDWRWDYYMNLSESDYPIKPMWLLEWYLAKYKGNNFIAFAGQKKNPEYKESQANRHTFYECDEHMWRLGKRELPNGIRYNGGSDWITLHRDFVEYIMSDSDQLVKGLKRLYMFTSFSTESFFHTLILNSAFCTKWINANLHMINWKKELGCQCQQLGVIDWCGCSPNDLKRADVPRILDHFNHTAYFARKFEPVVSNNVLNELDLKLHRDFKGSTGYDEYWQNDYHHKDGPTKDHDLFTTVTNSLIRRTHKTVLSVTPECSIKRTKILETTNLFLNDRFHSYLIKYSAVVYNNPEPVTFEVRFSVMHYQRKVKTTAMSKRFQSLEVGTNYDVKEQIFRNFVRFIGPNSKIILRHSWRDGPAAHIGLTWVDPAGVVAQFKEVLVESGNLTLQHDPELKTPLRPGEWVVKVTHTTILIAEMKFIVIPYSVYNGSRVTLNVAKKRHNGPEGHYFAGDLDLFADAFKVTDKKVLSNVAAQNGQKFGGELINWIDSLSGQVWNAKDICTKDYLIGSCPPFELCKNTKWSSMAHDPKSEIDKYFTYKSVMGYFRQS